MVTGDSVDCAELGRIISWHELTFNLIRFLILSNASRVFNVSSSLNIWSILYIYIKQNTKINCRLNVFHKSWITCLKLENDFPSVNKILLSNVLATPSLICRHELLLWPRLVVTWLHASFLTYPHLASSSETFREISARFSFLRIHFMWQVSHLLPDPLPSFFPWHIFLRGFCHCEDVEDAERMSRFDVRSFLSSERTGCF